MSTRSLPQNEMYSKNDLNVTSYNDIQNSIKYPTLVLRIQALFVDFVILLTVIILTTYLIDMAGGSPNWLKALVLVFVFFLYEPLLISIFGGTLGHQAMKIRVMQVRHHHKKLLVPVAIFRSLLKWLLGWLSFFTISFNKQRRAIHDLGSGSVVIMKQ